MIDRPFHHDLSGEPPRLVLHGELDEVSSDQLRTLIGSASGSLAHELTIDLTDVDFLPSAAVGVLAKAKDTARSNGAVISLVAAEGTIAQRVLTVCGMDYEVG